MTGPDPTYDLLACLQLAPGVVLTQAVHDGLAAAYLAGGYVPLTQAQVLAVTGTPPAYPTSLPRCDWP